MSLKIGGLRSNGNNLVTFLHVRDYVEGKANGLLLDPPNWGMCFLVLLGGDLKRAYTCGLAQSLEYLGVPC